MICKRGTASCMPCLSHPGLASGTSDGDGVHAGAGWVERNPRPPTWVHSFGRGVHFACAKSGKPPRSASCATDGEAGKQGARLPAAPAPLIDETLPFSRSVVLPPIHASQDRGRIQLPPPIKKSTPPAAPPLALPITKLTKHS